MLTKEDGTMTENGREVLTCLMTSLFPESVMADTQENKPAFSGKTITQESLSDPNYLTFINYTTVTRAFKQFGKYKAAGPDGLKPIAYQNLTEHMTNKLIILYKAVMALGFNPSELCHAYAIFLQKPNKENYTTAKAFRGISLYSFMLKGVGF